MQATLFSLEGIQKEKEAGAVIEDRVRRRSGAPSDHTEITTEDHKILSKHFVSTSRLRSTERTLVKRNNKMFMLMYRFWVSFVRATKVLSILCSKLKQTTRTPGRGGLRVVAL